MSQDPDYLFVYGTLLMQFTNPQTIHLKANSELYGRGSFSGYLFDLGAYPAAVYQEESKNRVFGFLYKLWLKEKLLKRLDEYEGISHANPQMNQYVRKVIPINSESEVIFAHCYLYNQSWDDLPVITSGNYFEYHMKKVQD